MSVSSITETSQYLTFKLEDEVFALDISKVREVLDFTNVAKVPQTPDFMLGVINLRGSVVPVVDMRVKFGMSRTERMVNTCIVRNRESELADRSGFSPTEPNTILPSASVVYRRHLANGITCSMDGQGRSCF